VSRGVKSKGFVMGREVRWMAGDGEAGPVGRKSQEHGAGDRRLLKAVVER
jgi:hypothetical protein